ncbi:hypothetical protein QOT17_017854 [Balamuthia mandrillaris]
MLTRPLTSLLMRPSREFGRLTALVNCDLSSNQLVALPCSAVCLLLNMLTQPLRQREAPLQHMKENDGEQEQEEETIRVKTNSYPPMRNNCATVKSLWHLSGEAVLRNKILPTDLLTPVPDLPSVPGDQEEPVSRNVFFVGETVVSYLRPGSAGNAQATTRGCKE